jgi:cobalt-zinc-cadmium resistance protein CzcA
LRGDNSFKIYGPYLAQLEELADKTKNALAQIHGLFDIGIFRIMGQSNVEDQSSNESSALGIKPSTRST